MKTKILDTLILIAMIILFALAHAAPSVGIMMMAIDDGLFQISGSVLLTLSIVGLVYIHHWNGSFRPDKKDLD